MERLKFIPTKYFKNYVERQPITLSKHFNKIKKNEINYGYAISVSAVSSSQIEGNVIDIETYYKFDTSGMNIKTKSFKEIKNLEKAYFFAQNNELNQKNMLKIHYLMTDPNYFEEKYRGNYRDKDVTVQQHANIVVYKGAKPEIVETEMSKLFADITILLKRKLTISQVFYYASLFHLIFVLIHPFADGNGRTARLIEKWFLSIKLGSNAWGINSEKLYLKRAKSYHKNINRLGKNYNSIDYSYSIPFLKMLPMALRIK